MRRREFIAGLGSAAAWRGSCRAAEQRKGSMKIGSMLLIALLAAFSAATSTSQSSPQGGMRPFRGASHRQKSNIDTAAGTAEHRTFLYNACMHSAGFPP
jgi:hypothetical protein